MAPFIKTGLLPRAQGKSIAIIRTLSQGESHTCTVLAALKDNWSGVRLEAGKTYKIEAPDAQRWVDGGIECGPAGWETVRLPWLRKKVVGLFEHKRRYPQANWCELIGAASDESFRIGADLEYTATHNADLYRFANDLELMYWNNKGPLKVTITCI